MEDNVILRVENLCQYFSMNGAELKAVDGISFEMKKGEVFGLVGESGCGKTTTGRSIAGVYRITSGKIFFQGRLIAAGTRSLEERIKRAKQERRQGLLSKEEYDKLVSELKETMRKEQYEALHCNRLYSREAKQKLDESVDAEALRADPVALAEYQKKARLIAREKFTTRIQMIFQDPVASLNPRMTIRETIAEGLVIKGIKDKKYIAETVNRVLDMVGLLPDHADRYPHEFSGGQRQRIGIARAIIMEPDLIIADEPVSALDVSIQAQVINLLNELRRKLGLTVLFIAHDLSVVKYFSDRIGVMYYGKIVELASSEELFAHPLHPYTKALLSAIPLPDPDYEEKRVRLLYNPLVDHDYTASQPSFREVKEGHFVYCDDAEFEKYREELAK